jgi:hypothetical protein
MADPHSDTNAEKVASQLADWDLEVETTSQVNGWLVVVGLGFLSQEDVREFFDEIAIASSVNAILHLSYVDGSGSYLGYLYHSDGRSLTEREYRRAEVFDYFKREHEIDGAY